MIGSLNVSSEALLAFAKEQGIVEPVGLPTVEALDAGEPIDVAGSTHVTFCRFDDDRGRRWLETTRAGAIFILPHLAAAARDHRDALYQPCEVRGSACCVSSNASGTNRIGQRRQVATPTYMRRRASVTM